MENDTPDIIELRHLEIEDYVSLRNSMDKAYEQTGLGSWKEEEIRRPVHFSTGVYSSPRDGWPGDCGCMCSSSCGKAMTMPALRKYPVDRNLLLQLYGLL